MVGRNPNFFSWIVGVLLALSPLAAIAKTIYERPSAQSKVLHQLKKGEKVKVLRISAQWYHVEVRPAGKAPVRGYLARSSGRKSIKDTPVGKVAQSRPERRGSTSSLVWMTNANWPEEVSVVNAGILTSFAHLKYDLNATPLDSLSANISEYDFTGLHLGVFGLFNFLHAPSLRWTLGTKALFRYGMFKVKLAADTQIPELQSRSVSLTTMQFRLEPRSEFRFSIQPVTLSAIQSLGFKLYMVRPSLTALSTGEAVFVKQSLTSPYLTLGGKVEFPIVGKVRAWVELSDRLEFAPIYSESPSGELSSGGSGKASMIQFLNPAAEFGAVIPLTAGSLSGITLAGLFELEQTQASFSDTGSHSQRDFRDASVTFGTWSFGVTAGALF